MRLCAACGLCALLALLPACSVSRERAWALTGLESPHREFRAYATDREGDLTIEVFEVVRFRNGGVASLREVLVEERLDWSLTEKLLALPMAAAAIPAVIVLTPVFTVKQAESGSRHPMPWYAIPFIVPLAGPMFAGGYLVSFVAFPVPLAWFTFPPYTPARDRERYRPAGSTRPATAEVYEGENLLPVVAARVRVRRHTPGAEWSGWMESDWRGSVELPVPGPDPAPPGTALEVEIEGETGLLRFPVVVSAAREEDRPPRVFATMLPRPE